MGCLRSWVGTLTGVDHRSVLIVRLVRSQLSTFFECAPYDSQRQIVLDCFKQMFSWMCFKLFFLVVLSMKLCFFLGEKQGMLVNDECSSRYDRVSDFWCRLGIGESKVGDFCCRIGIEESKVGVFLLIWDRRK